MNAYITEKCCDDEPRDMLHIYTYTYDIITIDDVCVSHRENKAQYLIFSINKQIGHVLCVKIITNNLIL